MTACRGQVRGPPLRIRHDSRLPSRRGDSSSVSSGRREWPRRCGHGSRVEVCVALSLLVRCDTRNVRPVREVVNWILRNRAMFTSRLVTFFYTEESVAILVLIGNNSRSVCYGANDFCDFGTV